ncbi:MAG: hypothetical protein NZ611_00495 [Bacteroidia bacterium]|nr:hypothetical protein [Bacteroidia bacterium]
MQWMYGVWLALIWGQTSSVWHWHHHAIAGNASPREGWSYSGTLSHGSIVGKVVVVGDTVYLLGTASHVNGGDALSLPNSSITLSVTNGGDITTYIAGYRRSDGAFLWALHLYGENGGGTRLRGVDLLVSQDHTIYVLFHGRSQNILGDNLQGRFVSSSISATLNLSSTIPSYQASFILKFKVGVNVLTQLAVQRLGCGSSGAGTCNPSNFEANFFNLLLHGGKLWVSGSVRTQALFGGGTYLLPSSFTFGLDWQGLFSLLGDFYQAMLLRMDASSLEVEAGAGVQGIAGNPRPNCYGRALFAFDGTRVGWLVGMRDAPRDNYQYRRVGDLSGSSFVSGINSPGLEIFLIRGSDLQIWSYGTLSFWSSAPNAPPPPHYQVIFSNQHLFYAVADTAYYRWGPTRVIPYTPEPKLIVGRVHLPSFSQRQAITSTPLPFLNVSSLVAEPRFDPMSGNLSEIHLYLSGTLKGSSWIIQGFGPDGSSNVSLPGSSIGETMGFVLGMKWIASSATWTYSGYKPIPSLSTRVPHHLVVCAGMGIHPSLPQFYLYGWARDSILIEPRWPDGRADTIRLATSAASPPRLWIGRLDLYRFREIPFNPSPPSRCSPDTVGEKWLEITGTWSEATPIELIWIPMDFRYSYEAKHTWSYIQSNSFTLNHEGTLTQQFPLIFPGRGFSDYLLAMRSPAVGNRFVEIEGTPIVLSINGTTIPYLQRTGALRWNRIVTRFIGSESGDTPFASDPSQSSSFWRLERRLNEIRSLIYQPWEGSAGGKECLYFLDTLLDDYFLHRFDFQTGLVERLRGWNYSVSDPSHRGNALFFDPVRGCLWGDSKGDRLWRIHPTDPTQDRELRLWREDGLAADPSLPVGYPLGSHQRWVERRERFACTEKGTLMGFVRHAGTEHWVLVRIAPERDSILIVAGGGHSPTNCPVDGVHTAAFIAQPPSHFTSDGDTLYWFEYINSGCSGPVSFLRKAWPSDVFFGNYEVQTIDTFFSAECHQPLFARVPARGLYFQARDPSTWELYLLWYAFGQDAPDTVLQCSSVTCCAAGLSDLVQMPYNPFPYTILRSGAIVYKGATLPEGIFIALPALLYLDQDTLRAEGTITDIQGAFYYPARGDTLFLTLPSDSTRFAIQTSSCVTTFRGKSLWYGSYTFPFLAMEETTVPDSVCEGMYFNTKTHTTLGGAGVSDECVLHHILYYLRSEEGKLARVSYSSFGDYSTHRWYAQTAGDDTLVIGLRSERWRRYVIGAGRYPIRVRRGHRLRLRLAIEGPWISSASSSALMRAHPFLSRAQIALYNEQRDDVSADSLWRLPRPDWDSLSFSWNPLGWPISSSLCSLNPAPEICDPQWTQIVRIEVYDASTHALVDSAYGLIDTTGHVFFYAAPLGFIGSPLYNNDTIHFCRCDPDAQKYFVIRTPNHLPLYTSSFALPARGSGSADSLDLTDPSLLQGIPGLHYTLLLDESVSPPRIRAAAWGGNCVDVANNFIPGPHYDSGIINAADWEYLLPRNGITSGFSWADIDSDGYVNAADALLLIQNQNELRQSVGP